MGTGPSPAEPLIRLLAQRALHHAVAALTAAIPYLVAGVTGVPWLDAAILSTAIVIIWLAGNAHIQGRIAQSAGTELVKGLHELLTGPGLGQIVGQVLPHLMGAKVGPHLVPTGPTRDGKMTPPPGLDLGGLIPGVQPTSPPPGA